MAKKLQLHGSFPSKAGENGGYYTPNVSNPDAETLEFTFTKSKEDMPTVPSVSVPIPSGAPEVHIGPEPPTNGEAIWINPDEEPVDVGDCITPPATASVGQTIVVKAVDEDGKPTEWEAADLPSGGGWKLFNHTVLTEEVSAITIRSIPEAQELYLLMETFGAAGNNTKRQVNIDVEPGGVRLYLNNAIWENSTSKITTGLLFILPKEAQCYTVLGTVTSEWCGTAPHSLVLTPPIKSMLIREPTGIPFGVGTRIQLYGR